MDVRRHKDRVRDLAGRQFGRVGRLQLKWLGIGRGVIENWVATDYLESVLPRVFAVGHSAPSIEADLCAAVLYAGPGAMLSHLTAAWWHGLIDFPGAGITVSTPKQCAPHPGIAVHGRRRTERIWHRELPTTTIAQTMLDLAAGDDPLLVRRALARLDYRRDLDVRALHAVCGPGRTGSICLKHALAHHQPRLAVTRSPLEDDFLSFCERFAIPVPEINVHVHGILVDAYWSRQRVVVELDGAGNHGTWAQIKRDRRNETTLRRHGILPLRYTTDQLNLEPHTVHADLTTTLDARAPR